MEWGHHQHHVKSKQQLGETLINHHLEQEIFKVFRQDVEGKKILNVNLNHNASNSRTRHIEK